MSAPPVRALARRLPLRVRLVAGFAAAMTVVLSGSGAFVYWRVEYALDRRLDTDLAAEVSALRPLLGPDGTLPVDSAVDALPTVEAFQVLDAGGRVVSHGAAPGAAPLLDLAALTRARRAAITLDVGSLLPISHRPLRLLAQPLTAGSPYVLVVGVRRDERDEALRELIAQLGVAALATLLITTVVGERLAKAALAPVERYRHRARAIAAGATGVRLDVPADREDEVTRLGRTLNEMLAALEESVQRERRFIDDASHELRTPLTLLLTRVQLTLRSPRSVAEHEAALRELQRDIVNLSSLAESLLALGAAGGGERNEEVGDVVTVVLALEPPVGTPRVPGLPPAWSFTGPPPGTTRVGLSDERLRQVLLNLLANAARHGSPPVTVTVTADGSTTGDVVVTAVGDDGPGIPETFLPRAVERFGRTGEARSRPGAGLGLALVHALVESHGGELRLCSNGVHHRYQHRFSTPCTHPEVGTTAVVLLPRRLP